jgi:hypothetical protein
VRARCLTATAPSFALALIPGLCVAQMYAIAFLACRSIAGVQISALARAQFHAHCSRTTVWRLV